MQHENSMSDKAVFITLTYDDEHLPSNGSLSVVTLQKFFKRFRKYFDHKIRYFACGEYGDVGHRPHYHAILFNVGFGDFRCYYVNGKAYYKHPAWDLGFIDVGTVTYSSCRYVAKYMFKQLFDDVNSELQSPFVLMSKGLGKSYALKHAKSLQLYKQVRMDGSDMTVPRYYAKILKIDFWDCQFESSRRFDELYSSVLRKNYKCNAYKKIHDHFLYKEQLLAAKERLFGGKL